MDSLSFQMRLNRSQEGDLFADHHHHEEGKRRRRGRREPLVCPEDTLELSGEEPPREERRGPQHYASLAVAGDPAAQVASYWLQLLEASQATCVTPPPPGDRDRSHPS